MSGTIQLNSYLPSRLCIWSVRGKVHSEAQADLELTILLPQPVSYTCVPEDQAPGFITVLLLLFLFWLEGS